MRIDLETTVSQLEELSRHLEEARDQIDASLERDCNLSFTGSDLDEMATEVNELLEKFWARLDEQSAEELRDANRQYERSRI